MQRQLMAFLIIGGAGALGFIGFSTAIIRLHPPAPSWVVSTLCYAVFILPIYMLHRRFTFDATVAHGRALPRYVAVQVLALGLTSVFSCLAYQVFGLPAAAGAVAVTCLTAACSFLILKFWAFASPGGPVATGPKRLLDAIHGRAVFGRRVAVLSRVSSQAAGER